MAGNPLLAKDVQLGSVTDKKPYALPREAGFGQKVVAEKGYDAILADARK